jgi:hypothetical protein
MIHAAWTDRRNNAAFIDPMKMGGILRRFFSGVEKAAGGEAGTEGHTGQDKKRPSIQTSFKVWV